MQIASVHSSELLLTMTKPLLYARVGRNLTWGTIVDLICVWKDFDLIVYCHLRMEILRGIGAVSGPQCVVIC